MASIILKKTKNMYLFILPNGRVIFKQPIWKLNVCTQQLDSPAIFVDNAYFMIYCFYTAERFGLIRRINF